jgi:hypothetical protein
MKKLSRSQKSPDLAKICGASHLQYIILTLSSLRDGSFLSMLYI